MASVQSLHVTAHGIAIPLPIVSLDDRRTTRPRRKQFVFSRSCETLLYGPSEVRRRHARPNPLHTRGQ